MENALCDLVYFLFLPVAYCEILSNASKKIVGNLCLFSPLHSNTVNHDGIYGSVHNQLIQQTSYTGEGYEIAQHFNLKRKTCTTGNLIFPRILRQ